MQRAYGMARCEMFGWPLKWNIVVKVVVAGCRLSWRRGLAAVLRWLWRLLAACLSWRGLLALIPLRLWRFGLLSATITFPAQ